jgi:hypothetical protein
VAKSAYKEWYDEKWKKEAVYLTHQLGLLTKAIKRQPSKEAVDAMAEQINNIKDSMSLMTTCIHDLESGSTK